MDLINNIIVVECNTNFNINYISPSGLHFFEYNSLVEIINKSITELMPEVSAYFHKEIFKEISKRRHDMSITRCIATDESLQDMTKDNMNVFINEDNIAGIYEKLTNSSPKKVLTKNKQVKEVLIYINLTSGRNSIIYMLPNDITHSSITNKITTDDIHENQCQEYKRQRKIGKLSKTLIKLKSI